MATYLQGSNKYIPQIQPYQPDLNFYKTVLETKSAQYDQGYTRVNNIYGTLLNSPLSRQDTAQMRNDFFSKANNEIQRLAGMDLSLEENQNAAFKVFKPLTTNPLFAKDIGYTKNLQKAFDRADYFKNCLNPKECGDKYWEEGVAYLNYQAQDFANADADKALRMSSPEYVPFVNIAKEALKYLGDSKFEMQTIQSDGRYNYTITNGVPAEAPLHNYLLAMYGNDANLQKMYKVSAYLQRKQYGEEHAEEFGGTQEAERDYIGKVLKAQDETLRSYKEEVASRQREINAKKSVADKYIQNEGVDPDADQDFVKYYQSLNSDLQATTATDDYYSSALDDTLPSAVESLDFDVLAERIDNMLGMSILDSDMAQIASAYATTTQKIEKEVDEIYLTQLKHQNSLSEIAARGSVQQSLEKTRQANRLEELYWESKLGVGRSSTTNKDGTPKINKTTTPGLEFLTDAEILQYKDNINKNSQREEGWSVKGTDPYAEGKDYELSEEDIKRLEEQGYVFEEIE
jgi:hypothetical protein